MTRTNVKLFAKQNFPLWESSKRKGSLEAQLPVLGPLLLITVPMHEPLLFITVCIILSVFSHV
jgi:hypothetical protein